MPAEDIALADMQGLIRSAFSTLKFAFYVLLHIEDRLQAHQWLAQLIDEGPITHSVLDKKNELNHVINIAFTHSGLKNMGLDDASLLTFSRPFVEGMSDSLRAQALGDDPFQWEWGNPGNKESLDIVLLVFARTQELLDEKRRMFEGMCRGGGVKMLRILETTEWSGREHFGFKDGLSQPVIRGMDKDEEKATTQPGEIVLGYPDHYGYVDYNPLVPGVSDTGSFLLPPSKEDQKRGAAPESRMFGRNGSYLVIRQLEQDVAHFWRFARRAAITNGESTERFAAKLIGRWPEKGAPLVISPDFEDPDQSEKNDFSYADDPNGMKCPFGAHIRRGNPRDMLAPLKTDQHRILRRGRSYGPAISDKFEDDGQRRGLFFICLNSDLERQFVLIQQSWVNNRFFNGLSCEVDPISHIQDNKVLTLPTDPLRRQVVRLNYEEPFVTVKGGAYFFMPGISALRYLAALR